MSVRDLADAKEKYLTNNFTTLNLNCKIVLFYTLTKKSLLNSIDIENEHQMVLISSPNALNGPSLNDNESLFRKNTNEDKLKSKRTKLNTTLFVVDMNHTENEDRFACWPNIETSKAINCNTLLYDIKRLFKHSCMYDLIIRAPAYVDSAAISYGSRLANSNLSNQDEFRQFKAHKIILAARSEVFEKMLNTSNSSECSFERPQQEKNSGTHESNRSVSFLDIVDFDAFTVEIFLNYLYTDTLEIKFNNISLKFDSSCEKSSDGMRIYNRNEYRQNSEESENEANSSDSDEGGDDEDDNDDDDEDDYEKFLKAEFVTHIYIQLYKIADKYCVYRLKKICESQLSTMINSDTLVELLVLSYLHGSSKLKRKCLDFLSENLSKVLGQPAWAHMEKFYPALLAEVFRTLYFKQINYGLLD
jgi:hypothetical protein